MIKWILDYGLFYLLDLLIQTGCSPPTAAYTWHLKSTQMQLKQVNLLHSLWRNSESCWCLLITREASFPPGGDEEFPIVRTCGNPAAKHRSLSGPDKRPYVHISDKSTVILQDISLAAASVWLKVPLHLSPAVCLCDERLGSRERLHWW